MILDLISVQVMSALVVNVSGILFVVETLLRRDEGAGRFWALGFLAGMLTTLAYTVWALTPAAWWSVAVGNAAFVAGTGCMWLGCRRFNGRRMTWPSLVVTAGVVVAGVSVVIDGPAGGDWAGALWEFAALSAFSAAGAIECLRGALRESRTAWVLFTVLALQSLFFVGRTVAFLVWGPGSAQFEGAFGTISTAFVVVSLTIVAVVVTSVLRATRAPVRGYPNSAGIAAPSDGIHARSDFDAALSELCLRAQWRGELVAVISVRIDDLEQISTAFGSDVARAIAETWRSGVRRHAPADAALGEDGRRGLLLAVVADSAGAARREAGAIYRGLFNDLGTVAGGVIPVVGVGVALSEVSGYEAAALARVAREAAARAATSVEASVLVGEAE